MQERHAIALMDPSKQGLSLLPWAASGHTCWSYHSDHKESQEGATKCGIQLHKYADDNRSAILERHEGHDIAFVAVFPPHADISLLGSQWWGPKSRKDPKFQERAMDLARRLHKLAIALGGPYYVENPQGLLSNYMGEATAIVEPYQFGGYIAPDDYEYEKLDLLVPEGDWYRRRRLIWTGNGLKLPEEKRAPGEVERISAMPRGQKRVLQEYPPRGFNKGVYEVNQ